MGKKQKQIRYERVRHLPNVTLSEFGRPENQGIYPWQTPPFAGMKKILELGCGKGEHTLAFAAENPDCLFMGIDIKSHRICLGAEKAIEKKIKNVHFLRAPVEDLRHFFSNASINEIWLTFPDPHPKKRTIKSRLTAASFLELYAYLLVPGGTIHLKTDSDLLHAYTQETVQAWGGKTIAVSENIHGEGHLQAPAVQAISTFEDKALAKGATIKYAAFTLN